MAQPLFTDFLQSPRQAARILSQFMLRQWEIVSQQADGDLYMAVVFTAIIAANVQHIGHTTEQSREFGALDNAPPDEARRPISTHALAHSLGLPYETTRRNVNKLMALGVVVRVPGQGLVVPASYLQSPKNISDLMQSVSSLQWLLASLRRAGFDLNALADGGVNIPPPAGVRAPPGKSTGSL
jgi:DNA-binding transcriptional regulator YhcF (GntR family)